MTDLQPHADNAAPVLFTVAAIIGAAFEAQMIVIFLCAILGAGVGLAFRPAMEPSKSKFETALRFMGHTGYILCNAIITSFASYWFSKYWRGAEYPMAFFVSMVLMIYRELIISTGAKLISRKSEGV